MCAMLPAAAPCPQAPSSMTACQDAHEFTAAPPDAPEPAPFVPDTCSPDEAEPPPVAAQGAGVVPNPDPNPEHAAALGGSDPVPDRAAVHGRAAEAGAPQDAGEWEMVAQMEAAGGGKDAGPAPAELMDMDQPGGGHRAGAGAGVAAGKRTPDADGGEVLDGGFKPGAGAAAGAAHAIVDARGAEGEGEPLDEFGLTAEERAYLDDVALWHADAEIASARSLTLVQLRGDGICEGGPVRAGLLEAPHNFPLMGLCQAARLAMHALMVCNAAW